MALKSIYILKYLKIKKRKTKITKSLFRSRLIKIPTCIVYTKEILHITFIFNTTALDSTNPDLVCEENSIIHT